MDDVSSVPWGERQCRWLWQEKPLQVAAGLTYRPHHHTCAAHEGLVAHSLGEEAILEDGFCLYFVL